MNAEFGVPETDESADPETIINKNIKTGFLHFLL
jgi:hypothetical protein